MLLLVFFLAFVIATTTKHTPRTLSDVDRYTALTASLTALEGNPSHSSTAKIQLILQSTDYLALQAQHAPPSRKKRFMLKQHK